MGHLRLIYIAIAACILALDQLTKRAIVSRFTYDTMVTVIPGFFNLVRVENRGIAFGFLSGLSSGLAFGVILTVSMAALGVVCYLLWKTALSSPRAGLALALILGGAAGNLVDRVFRGSVVDFLDFYFRSYHWYTFNIADSAIVVGAGLLLIDLFQGPPAKTATGQ